MRLSPLSVVVITVLLLASVLPCFLALSELRNSVLIEKYAGVSRIGRSFRLNDTRGKLPDSVESVRL